MIADMKFLPSVKDQVQDSYQKALLKVFSASANVQTLQKR